MSQYKKLPETLRGVILKKETDFTRANRNLNKVTRLDQLTQPERLASFSAGILQMRYPLIMNPIEDRTYGEEFMGSLLLEDLQDSHQVLWLPLGTFPETTIFNFSKPNNQDHLSELSTLQRAHAFHTRAYYQMPNAVIVMVEQPEVTGKRPATRNYSPAARHQRSNMQISGLSSATKVLPVKILHDHIERESWRVDGEIGPDIGCQTLVLMSNTLTMANAKDFANEGCTRFRMPKQKDVAKGYEKTYVKLSDSHLSKSQIRDAPAFTRYIQDVAMEEWTTWGEVRKNIALLQRLSRLHAGIEGISRKLVKKSDWKPPSELLARVPLAESLMRDLQQGFFHLGEEPAGFQDAVTMSSLVIPKATAEGQRMRQRIQNLLSEAKKS